MKANIKAKNILFLTIAGIINAFGVTVFLAPVKLYDSGISGTSMLISQMTPSWLSLSMCLVLLNIPIFLYGLKKQGPTFTIYAIYTVVIYSICAWLITDVLPIDVSIVSPLAGSDLFLCAIFGGIISGVGSGLAIRSWILPLYSIVTYAAALKTVDFIIEGFDRSKAANIITTKPQPVCAALSEEFENGITIVEAKGYYSDSKKTMPITEVADIYASNLDKTKEIAEKV